MTNNISTNARILLAERLLRAGQWSNAQDILNADAIQVKPIQALIACGDKCMQIQDSEEIVQARRDALNAYKEAGATWKLIELGDACSSPKRSLTPEEIELALDAYSAANAGPQIATLGERALKSKQYARALTCFVAISDRKGMMKLARQSTNVAVVIDAYIAAEANEELIATGSRLIEKIGETKDTEEQLMYIRIARKAFEAAHADAHLVQCAEAYLDRTVLESWRVLGIKYALEIYAQVKAPLPTERLLAILDGYIADQLCSSSQEDDVCEMLCNAGIVPESLS